MKVSVWPDRYARAWDGRAARSSFPEFPVVPLSAALQAEYPTHAHFCPAVLGEQEAHPRLTVGLDPALRAEVRFHVIVLDIDAPGKQATDEWRLAQREALANSPWDGAIQYDTKGGYRLVWELPQALTIEQYLATLDALRAVVLQYGVVADPLTDWTRAYGLPFVVRDGKRQTLAFYDSPNPVFPLGLLNVAQKAEQRLGQAVVNAPLSVRPDAGQGDRNKTMFRLMSGLRNHSWLEQDLAEEWALALNTRFDPPLPEDEVLAVVRNVWRRYSPRVEEEEQTTAATSRPALRIEPGKIHEAVDTVLEAVGKLPDVFQRDGLLCRVVGGRIHDINVASLRTLACSTLDFLRMKEDEWRPSDPPRDLLDSVVAHRGSDKVRELEQVYTMPGIRPDGVVLNSTGYDPVTKALVVPEFSVDVPTNPSVTDAMAALERIKDLYVDFPFETEAHRAAAVASLMTPILRLAIQGPTPMFVFESSTPGAGKTIMANMVAVAASGAKGTPMAPVNEEETTKQITSQLLLGAKIIWIDNVARPLGGPALDAALTSDRWAARRLGVNEMLHLRNTATWMATGNNITLAGDMRRRVIRVYIDPRMETPESRDTSLYKYPDLLGHIARNRQDIVRDVLTMAVYRKQSAFRIEGAAGMGSFEEWSYWVRETLMQLGMDDCLDTQTYYKEGGELVPLRAFLYGLERVFSKTQGEFNAQSLHNVLFCGYRPGGTEQEIQTLISCYKEMVDKPGIPQIAEFLNKWKGRIVGGRVFRRKLGNATESATYVISSSNAPALRAVV